MKPTLVFGQNGLRNRWDIADIEFPVAGGSGCGGGGSVKSFSYQTQLL